MSSLYGLLKRIKAISDPPTVEKTTNVVRFGILGAANIAPTALILPARSHPGVQIVAVAARDEQRARAFAKKHSIERVYYGLTGYQEMVEDPNIDAIYNPLPNGLHFEWAAKALAAGKHVLLEKPSTDTSEEARKLFEIAREKGVVLLEAFHYRFHPAFHRLKEIVDSGELGKIKSITSELAVPSGFIKYNDIRFEFDLGGGSLMDMGSYTISAVRAIASAEPTSVMTATYVAHPGDPERIDRGARATLAFPNDITAEIACDMRVPWYWGILPMWPKVFINVQLEGGEVRMMNFVAPHLYHHITVTPKGGKERVEKVYKPKEGKGEEWWPTYRHQLEVFVDRIQGRTPHSWMSEEDTINQMKVIEQVYDKMGLPQRPTSKYAV